MSVCLTCVSNYWSELVYKLLEEDIWFWGTRNLYLEGTGRQSQYKSYLSDIPFEASGNLEFISLFKEDVSYETSLDSIVSELPCRNIDAAGRGKLRSSYFSGCKWYGFSKLRVNHFALVYSFSFRFLSVGSRIESRQRLSSAAACDKLSSLHFIQVSEVALRIHRRYRLSTLVPKIYYITIKLTV
jgi:hypothetical protein